MAVYLIKYSRASSRSAWLSGKQTNVSRAEIAFETSVYSTLNQLTQLLARKHFIVNI